MPDGSLELEKQPMPNVGAPASGSYGQGASLQRLQDALPPMAPAPGGPGQQQQNLPPVSSEPVRPTDPQREGRPPSGAALPPGVPAPLLDSASAGPAPAPAAVAPQLTPEQKWLAILDQLAEGQGVSDATKTWARLVRRAILGA